MKPAIVRERSEDDGMPSNSRAARLSRTTRPAASVWTYAMGALANSSSCVATRRSSWRAERVSCSLCTRSSSSAIIICAPRSSIAAIRSAEESDESARASSISRFRLTSSCARNSWIWSEVGTMSVIGRPAFL
jgi:hypothetical protein